MVTQLLRYGDSCTIHCIKKDKDQNLRKQKKETIKKISMSKEMGKAYKIAQAKL